MARPADTPDDAAPRPSANPERDPQREANADVPPQTRNGTVIIPEDAALEEGATKAHSPGPSKTPERTPTTDEDSRFANSILQSRFATRDQLESCLDEVARLAAQGITRCLRDVMVDRKILSPAQANAIALAARKKQTSVFGGFQIERKVGEGAMGGVYKARQVALDRTVALKVLPADLVKDHAFVRRFLSEARLAAKLDHPNVVRAIDFGEIEGKYYFAMEFVEGHTLEKELEARGALPEEEALGRAIQAARGLECAWRGGLVHRDIKPDNMLINNAGELKIADLGLARETDRGGAAHRSGERMAMGTPDYIAPEQARAESVDIRADIYALGITLYRTVTGRFPFEGEDALTVVRARFEQTPRPAHAVEPRVSREFSRVIEVMMARDREARYPDPSVLIHDLELLAAGRPPEFAGEDAAGRDRALEAARSRDVRTGSFTVVAREGAEHAGASTGPDAPAAAFYRRVLAMFDEDRHADVVRAIDEEGNAHAGTKYAPLLEHLHATSAALGDRT